MNVRATNLARRRGHAGPQLDILTEEHRFGALYVAGGPEQHDDDAGQRKLAECMPDRRGAERPQHRMQSVACELARALAPRAELVLLHAFEVPVETRLRSAGVQDETLRNYREIAQSQAERAMQAFLAAASLPSAPVTTLLLHGDASSLINEQEQERDCDLVVVGEHGESTVDDFLLGSVTKHVLQE